MRRICCETKVVAVETEGAVKVTSRLPFRLGTQEPVTCASGACEGLLNRNEMSFAELMAAYVDDVRLCGCLLELMTSF